MPRTCLHKTLEEVVLLVPSDDLVEVVAGTSAHSLGETSEESLGLVNLAHGEEGLGDGTNVLGVDGVEVVEVKLLVVVGLETLGNSMVVL